MISAGLYSPGADADIDAAIDLWPSLDAALEAQHDQGVAHSFDQLTLILRRGGRAKR